MTPLFGNWDGTDETYNRLRNPPAGESRKYLVRGREFLEKLWERTSEYVDSDLPDKATRQFHQCFWEMYLAATLLDLRLRLVPRAARKKRDAGPDLQVGSNVWLEAIAVTEGTGPDAVATAPIGVASQVPDNQMKLRLISGVDEKRGKFERYEQIGIIGPDDVRIVALNATLVPPLHFEWHPPRIVRALMEFGNPVLMLDRQTRNVVERTNEHQTAIKKLSGSEVGQGMFHDGTCRAVSACLYSVASFTYDREVLGCDFDMVHNPTATVPLPRGLVPRGKEHWTEGDELVTYNHGP